MLDKNKTGLILGAFFGLVHLFWAIVVAGGFAQAMMDFIYSIHFLNNPFIIQAFNPTTAITLVIVTAIIGYIFGWLFAWIWNMVQKKK